VRFGLVRVIGRAIPCEAATGRRESSAAERKDCTCALGGKGNGNEVGSSARAAKGGEGKSSNLTR
jgi:hypothetical protein